MLPTTKDWNMSRRVLMHASGITSVGSAGALYANRRREMSGRQGFGRMTKGALVGGVLLGQAGVFHSQFGMR